MTRRTKNQTIGDLAQTRVREIFERAGWVVNDLFRDYGEDQIIRIFENGDATPYSFFVQSKGVAATTKKPRFSGAEGDRFHVAKITKRHLSQWRRFSLPVLVTLWDQLDDQVYWEMISSNYFAWDSNPRPVKDYVVRISEGNTLDDSGVGRICNLVKDRHEILTNFGDCVKELISLLHQYSSVRVLECDAAGPFMAYTKPASTRVFWWGNTGEILRLLAELNEWNDDQLEEWIQNSLLPVADMSKFVSRAGLRRTSDIIKQLKSQIRDRKYGAASGN
jgi:hypothetical protein